MLVTFETHWVGSGDYESETPSDRIQIAVIRLGNESYDRVASLNKSNHQMKKLPGLQHPGGQPQLRESALQSQLGIF